MPNIKLDPYVFFDGDCRPAMEFYKDLFGGELELQTYGEAPVENGSESEAKIMHAYLHGGLVDLMASDSPNPSDSGTGKVQLSLSGADETQLRDIFEKLSQGGAVTYALKKEFWGDIFGTLVDAYGVNWMINITKPDPGKLAE